MKVQGLTLALRPRSPQEAADLGVRMAQASTAWRLMLPLWAALVLALLAYPGSATWVPTLVLFACKPWIDRVLLFAYSRAAFGLPSGWAELWAARREVLFGQWLATFTLRRLSPWRAFTQPIHQLEGQRGAARRARRRLLSSGLRDTAAMMQLAFAVAESMLVAGMLALVLMLQPGLSGFNIATWLRDDPNAWRALTLLYGLAVAAVEPFYVAAGFAMYLNRRVELEAWDVEQELRRVFQG